MLKTWLSKGTAIGVGLGALLLASPASAHHAMGGQVPTNFAQGFLSGLAHPVIGIDHLAFVIAAGLLAVTKRRGLWIPVAFVVAALCGTALHLQNVNLPASEFFVAASVLVFGILLALPQSPNLAAMIGLGAIAGIFHGYAYGESIVGAPVNPLVAYLLGFTAIQLAIAVGAAKVGQLAVRFVDRTPQSLRYAGFTISGLGAAFMVSRLGL
jgi:urease accessory protein